MKKNKLQNDNRVHQLERLIESGQILNTTYDLKTLLQTIIENASELVSCEEASILLYNESKNTLEFAVVPWFYNNSLDKMSVPIDKSIAGEVFSTKKPVFVKDAKKDQRLYHSVDNLVSYETNSMLAVPLKIKENTIGVLSAVNKKSKKDFDNSDLAILEILASQAAIAIQNVQLLANSQKAFDELAELELVKSDFIAITSHELRTPLGLILGNSTYLKEIVSDDLKPQMEVIYRSSVQLKGIVEDLSKVNQSQTGQEKIERKMFDVSKMLKSIISDFKGVVAEKRIILKLSTPQKKLNLWGDEEKISIAVNHLLKNAISFTKEDDKIFIRAEELPEFIKIEIEDTGIGIPKKELNKVFDRFYQVENHMIRKHGGMGLGLSVSKMMIELHNGRLGVHSEEGKGSVFQIMLPISNIER